MPRVRARAIHAGDLVRVNKRGRLFHAQVTGVAAGGGFVVAPIERNVSYRHVTAREIVDHWAHARQSRGRRRLPASGGSTWPERRLEGVEAGAEDALDRLDGLRLRRTGGCEVHVPLDDASVAGLDDADRRVVVGDRQRALVDPVGVGARLAGLERSSGAAALEAQRTHLARVGRGALGHGGMPGVELAEVADALPHRVSRTVERLPDAHTRHDPSHLFARGAGA